MNTNFDEMRETKVSCKGVIIYGNTKRICGQVGTNKTFHRVVTKNHGSIFLCPSCYDRIEGYSDENGLKVNGEKKHGYTYSFEMELTAHHDAFDRMLQYNNFMATSDCTVAVEYKSPIYQSLNGIRKLFRSMSNGLDHDDYFDYACGTHCNIGHTLINGTTISYLKRFYHSLFLPLSNWLELNPEATEKIYGRSLTRWATPIHQYSDPDDHTNFINLQHNTHVEFRLCKFVNENQYVDCVQLNTRMMTAIIKNFIGHFNDSNFDTRRYANITEYRKHKAVMVANKLVSLIEKECDKKGYAYTSL